ncbi:unnamed protein product [Brassicogethes aeneus]|uniref:Uncharacterized protein n=1 Tax=Brassicogethes aeneus TaxID=1431903 RepID=A0A9P0BCL7_BRAAE|nr:unnamed protein product [Brassicogethes aeneus]
MQSFMRRFETEEESDGDFSDKENEEEENRPLFQEPELSDDESAWVAPSIGQETLLDLDFTPRTREQEPSVPAPKAHIAAQGVECQKLGKTSFSRIRYAEVQKKLQAAPVFSALRVNLQLANLCKTSPLQDQLIKMDLTFGTVVHGLLLQREAFSEGVKELVIKHPEIKSDVQSLLMGSDSSFRSISDDLLQNVCRRRAEIIEQRRSLIKP